MSLLNITSKNTLKYPFGWPKRQHTESSCCYVLFYSIKYHRLHAFILFDVKRYNELNKMLLKTIIRISAWDWYCWWWYKWMMQRATKRTSSELSNGDDVMLNMKGHIVIEFWMYKKTKKQNPIHKCLISALLLN